MKLDYETQRKLYVNNQCKCGYLRLPEWNGKVFTGYCGLGQKICENPHVLTRKESVGRVDCDVIDKFFPKNKCGGLNNIFPK